MGLLDGLVGNVIGSMLNGNQTQTPLGTGRNQAQGGNLFRQSGLGQHADSWVGTGQNMNISSDQLQ